MSEAPPTAIRTLQQNDIPACTTIFIQAYADVYGEQWSGQAAAARITHVIATGPRYCLVAEAEPDLVVGFLLARPFPWYDGTRLWIEELVVDAPLRGKGWGSRLLTGLDDIAQADDIVSFALLAKEGSAAERLYRRLGYAPAPWRHLERPAPRKQVAGAPS